MKAETVKAYRCPRCKRIYEKEHEATRCFHNDLLRCCEISGTKWAEGMDQATDWPIALAMRDGKSEAYYECTGRKVIHDAL